MSKPPRPHPPYRLLRPRNLYLVLSYLALSMAAFLPLALGLPLAQPAHLFGVTAVGWIALWALFKRPAWFHLLLLPAFLALPVDVYLYVYYGQGLGTHHLGILTETSPLEAMEFLGAKVWLLGAVLAGVLAWWASSWRAAFLTRDLDWNDRSRFLVLGLLGAALALHVYGGPAEPPAKVDRYRLTPAPQLHLVAAATGTAPAAAPSLPAWARLPFPAQAFAQSRPFGLLARGYAFYQERVYLGELRQRSAAFRFRAVQADAANAPDVIVMVLGESSRFDRWRLNGYARDTNPLLARETNLVSFQDLVTSVSATRLSIPVILSRKPATQSLKDGFTEKSFISAYQEAGYKTWWLSNQVSFSKFDTPVSVFAQEADSVEFLNLGGFSDRSHYDEVLLAPFERALRDPAPRKLIVLHTLGSHWNYAHRYPPRFDHWQPSLLGVRKPVLTDATIEQQLNNSYDNAILYTDWFLAQLLAQLKQPGLAAALVYAADHGQTLYDGSCRQVLHGHNSQFEFHVPGLAWYSDAYGARFPDKVAQLRAHRAAPLSTENVFHTMLDLGNLRYPGEDLTRSIASARLTRHKRYVDSYGWADYDNARIVGDCREVIDKGKPRPRG